MKKILKKLSSLVLIFIILVVNFVPMIPTVEAKTLRDLKEELEQLKKQAQDGQNQKHLTEAEIAKKKATISSINEEIHAIEQETINLTKEIEELNNQIVIKKEEIKKIVNYYQLSNGESAYLEYAFSAVSFTDFIYRLAVAEQLSNYNDRLVDEYNQMIIDNENKKVELSNRTVELNNKQNQLEQELLSLGTQLGEILEYNVTIEEDIASMEELIDTYENVKHCQLDEDISVCGKSVLPPGTSFYRPVVSGRVSSNYGYYYAWGRKEWHYGMDFSQTGHGANVYSIANGRVSYITRKAGCGGNMVYIEHVVNGVNYTSAYFHLATINVDVGDVVTYNTVIGTVGGNPSIETWDRCSTGTHVHLQLGYGHVSSTTVGYYTRFTARAFDPRQVLNAPSEGSYFSDRQTKY